jgi:Ca-activated chloride channel family protein
MLNSTNYFKNCVAVLGLSLCVIGCDPMPATAQAAQGVPLIVTVTNDKGRAVPGLKESDFSVTDGTTTQTIISFRSLDEPISVGLLFDMSGSMRSYGSNASTKQRLELLNQAFTRFLEQSNSSNEYFVAAFDSQPYILSDWTSDHRVIRQAIAGIVLNGETAFYDACYAGIQKVLKGRYGKRVIILFSDGEDNRSRHSFNELRELLKGSNVLVYSMTIIDPDNYSGSLSAEGQDILSELTTITGAKAFFPRIGGRFHDGEVGEVVAQIASELRHQYTLEIAPVKSEGDRRWHRIKVKLAPQPHAFSERKHLFARVRQGYYSSMR